MPGSVQPDLFPVPPRDAAIGAIETWARETARDPLMGVDEAGRGPLAGPVVAAAVVFPTGALPEALEALDDSKKLTPVVRARLVLPIVSHACAVGVGRADAATIDDINILAATRRAMHQAVSIASDRLGRAPATLVVDGNLPLPAYDGEQWPLVKGDSRSWSIAAASVIAKVVRDTLMLTYHRRYPAYGFAQHKGYGTVAHRRALVEHGPCPIHRKSFRWKAP